MTNISFHLAKSIATFVKFPWSAFYDLLYKRYTFLLCFALNKTFSLISILNDFKFTVKIIFVCCRPENLVLTITGKMDEQDLFETLRKTEEKVLRKRHVQGCDDFIRPWQTPLKKLNLKEDLIYEIDYPSEDETLGM